MVTFVLANTDLVGSRQLPQLLPLGNLQVDYSHEKPTPAYGFSELQMTGSEPSSLDTLDGGYGGLLLGFQNSIMVPTIGTSGKSTIYGSDPLVRSARPSSDDIEAPVTFQAGDGHLFLINGSLSLLWVFRIRHANWTDHFGQFSSTSGVI